VETQVADTQVAERQRLAALHALRILDTPREERFDRVVRLAQRLFDVPVAAVSLIDADRHWNKASVGMPARQFSRSESMCDHTIRQPGALVVPDLAEDDRFRHFPSVTADHPLRFYAGQPLEANGQRVGALCLLDEEPRELSEAQLELLAELARWVEHELVVTEELRHAGEIQRRLQPSGVPELPGYEVAGGCVMAAAVGGDFYDWYEARGQFQIVVGDVMGKGIGAAIIAAGVRATLRGGSRFNDLPEAVIRTAYSVQQDLDDTGAFVTVFAARLDPATGAVEYVDAGHGLAVIFDADGGYRQLTTGGLPLGALTDDRWVSCTTTLEPGETLLVVSDGLLDCYPSAEEALGVAQDLVLRSDSGRHLVDEILGIADDLAATDDVTLVVVRRAA
jgi:serine phosphatase RsbU (regulator of sigma subunit)